MFKKYGALQRVLAAAAAVLTVATLVNPFSAQTVSADLNLLKPLPGDPATFVGRGGYSADGAGFTSPGATVQAEVPAGSTVVQAYLYLSHYFNESPVPVGDRTIDFDGTVVVATEVSQNQIGFLHASRATVTAQVAAKVGAGGGITNFSLLSLPPNLNGVALVVLFSNPALPITTIAVLDGEAKQAGDSATFALAAPLDKTAPGFSATMSLGIGHGFQGVGGHLCGGGQFSTIDVNGARLTSCAGNYDDGLATDGALITVGGVGDSTNNPADPFATDSGEDDELYNIAPFLKQGDTQIVIATANPSSDDNVFLAIIAITAEATVTTEICDDGKDNDGDGKIDGDDPDCFPRITIVKTVKNDDNGTLGPNDFSFTLDGNPVPQGIAQTVAVGPHTVAEIPNPAYTAGAWGGACNPDGTIVTVAGGSYTCTILNDDKPSTNPCADLNGGFERGAAGLADCWTLTNILDGISRVEDEGSCFGANNTKGITFVDGRVKNTRALNVRSSAPAPLGSVGIATSDPFTFGSAINFKALSENDDAIPSPDPVLSWWRLLSEDGTVELATGVFVANILTTSPGTTNDGCLVGDLRDGAFSSHSIDTANLAGTKGRLQFRQHTKVEGKGFFTLIDNVSLETPSAPVKPAVVPTPKPRVGPPNPR